MSPTPARVGEPETKVQAVLETPSSPFAPPAAPLGIVPARSPRATSFDREKIVLYLVSLLAVLLVLAVYFLGYLLPAMSYGRAIVGAAKADPQLSGGCYLLWLEHANRLQSAYSLRFLGMLIGTLITFVGMAFAIKGLEAGYSLDLSSGQSSASLKTASPGLVLCTLGIALCTAVALHTMELTFEMSPQCL